MRKKSAALLFPQSLDSLPWRFNAPKYDTYMYIYNSILKTEFRYSNGINTLVSLLGDERVAAADEDKHVGLGPIVLLSYWFVSVRPARLFTAANIMTSSQSPIIERCQIKQSKTVL